MIAIAVTQRVMDVAAYPERRDALDQRWAVFLLAHGFWPVLVPNNAQFAEQLFQQHALRGLLLTGGESLVHCGGEAPERDHIESSLLAETVARGLPVVGVCRGMQVIQHYFGGTLVAVAGHVRTRHALRVNPVSRHAGALSRLETVNAFHTMGAFEPGPELQVAAWAEDGVIMAVEHRELPIFGQMWHSEREAPFVPAEAALLQQAFHP